MENIDFQVLRTLADWLSAGERAALCTVTRTWGSSPRPVGSIMAMSQAGIVGSVSGGCIEDDLFHRFSRKEVAPGFAGLPSIITYGISADEAHRFGLPCGGTLEVLVEPEPQLAPLLSLLESLGKGQLVQRTVNLQDGCATVQPAPAEFRFELNTARLCFAFGPRYRMLLIGAGQLAEYLANMAQACGFEVAVCDPREEYNRSWAVASARLTGAMPDDFVMESSPDARTCVITLTHDPKLDDLALMEALRSDAFYVGPLAVAGTMTLAAIVCRHTSVSPRRRWEN